MKRNDLEIYNTYAAKWWDGSERWLRLLQNMVPARLKFFEKFTGSLEGAKVLDLGCGGGFLAEELARRGAEVTGIDPAAQAIMAARAHAEAEGLEISYSEGVAEALPFSGDSFDYVICVDVLEHIGSVETTLAEVARVLRPDGLFLFDTINRTWLARLVMITLAENLLGILPRGSHDPDMFIRPRELFAAMKQVGLRPGKITGLGPVGIDRQGDLRFGQVPLRSVIYMGSAVADKG